jgi:hypothetical protein
MALPLAHDQSVATQARERAELSLAPSPAENENEQRRWIVALGLEFASFATFFVLLFGTGVGWFIVPALMSVAIAGPITLIRLALSSDTNQWREIARTERRMVTPTDATLEPMRTHQNPTRKGASK